MADITISNRQVSLVDIRLDSQRFPRLRSYTREAAAGEMAKIVSQAFLYKGQSTDITNVQFIALALIDELMTDNQLGTKGLTFEEISRAIKKAILTSDMFGISVASLYRAITTYIKDEGLTANREAIQIAQQRQRELLSNSAVGIMTQAAAGKMIKKLKK